MSSYLTHKSPIECYCKEPLYFAVPLVCTGVEGVTKASQGERGTETPALGLHRCTGVNIGLTGSKRGRNSCCNSGQFITVAWEPNTLLVKSSCVVKRPDQSQSQHHPVCGELAIERVGFSGGNKDELQS